MTLDFDLKTLTLTLWFQWASSLSLEDFFMTKANSLVDFTAV